MPADVLGTLTPSFQAAISGADMSSKCSVRLFLVATAALLLCAGVRPVAQAPSGQYATADVAYGARVYAAQCSVCHGATGNEVAGVDFHAGRFGPATTDAELRNIIRNGVEGTAMPPFSFSDAELTGVVAYLRNIRDFNAASVQIGDAAKGRTLFEGRGQCATCHRVMGTGPRVAPDLSAIGAVRTAADLEQTLLDPDAAIRPVNRSIRAVTHDGEVVTGRRLNEDTYSVQLIDEHEELRSIDKADLHELTVVMKSSMPAYGRTLTSSEIADLVAYLLSLKGIS